jgi:hypothetical protein
MRLVTRVSTVFFAAILTFGAAAQPPEERQGDDPLTPEIEIFGEDCGAGTIDVGGVCTPRAWLDDMCDLIGGCEWIPGLPPLPPDGDGGGDGEPRQPTAEECDAEHDNCATSSTKAQSQCVNAASRSTAIKVAAGFTCHGNDLDIIESIEPFTINDGPVVECTPANFIGEAFDGDDEMCRFKFREIAERQCMYGIPDTQTTSTPDTFSIAVNLGFGSFNIGGGTQSITVTTSKEAGHKTRCSTIANETDNKCNDLNRACHAAAQGVSNLEISVDEVSMLLGQIDEELLGLTVDPIDLIGGSTFAVPGIASFKPLSQEPLEPDQLYEERLRFLAHYTRFLQENSLTVEQKTALIDTFAGFQRAYMARYDYMIGLHLWAWRQVPETGEFGTDEARKLVVDYHREGGFGAQQNDLERGFETAIREILSASQADAFLNSDLWKGVGALGRAEPMQGGPPEACLPELGC